MGTQFTVLAVDDDRSFLASLGRIFHRESVEIVLCEDGYKALETLRCRRIDLALIDWQMPGLCGFELLNRIKAGYSRMPVVMLTGHGKVPEAVRALKCGADDFIEKPFPPSRLVELVRDYVARYEPLSDVYEQNDKSLDFPDLIGSSPAMMHLKEMIGKVGRTNVNVLLYGETGSGKEVVARALHFISSRKDCAFVPVDCATLSENIIESELFGHKQGAFTGASEHRKGLFVEANGGTLFLDEIGEFDLRLQAKLLRVLQERQVRPIGSNKAISVDIRLIAASNKNLQQESALGSFRPDLFHRLSNIVLEVPPLRDRKEDIPALIEHILSKVSSSNIRISDEVLLLFEKYSWPGNIRELQNILIGSVALCSGGVVKRHDIPDWVRSNVELENGVVEHSDPLLSHERIALESTLEQTGGNRRQAAKILNISEATLYRKLKKAGIGKSK